MRSLSGSSSMARLSLDQDFNLLSCMEHGRRPCNNCRGPCNNCRRPCNNCRPSTKSMSTTIRRDFHILSGCGYMENCIVALNFAQMFQTKGKLANLFWTLRLTASPLSRFINCPFRKVGARRSCWSARPPAARHWCRPRVCPCRGNKGLCPVACGYRDRIDCYVGWKGSLLVEDDEDRSR